MPIALVVVTLLALAAAALLAAALRRAREEARAARAAAEDERRAVAAAERRRHEALRLLPYVVLRLDGTGRLTEANRAALERFPFLVAGMSMLEAFSEHRLAERVDAALGTPAPDQFEVRLFADGRRTYSVTVEPYEIDGVREALVLLADASEAADYRELRSQFVANVSHELRTPLTGLRGLLEALDDPGMEPAVHQDFVRRATSETLRLEALVTDILFLSELESASAPPPGSRTDLSAVALATADGLRETAAEHGARVGVAAPAPAWVPLTDRMGQVLVRNRVENAIKFAGAGASTRATVRAEAGEVVLTVSDDGAGIPERHLPHVFERFYRADPSRSKRLGGTGLGLSIVKHIAERFGGEAVAASREGFGTTITVTIPSAAP